MPESLVPTPLAPFAALEDPRLDRTKRYHPLDVIFMAPCAVVSGANDGVAMEKFGKSKRAWLEKYLSLPTGTPCHDTFTRVFAAVDGEAIVACFLKWVEALPESTDGQLVAIDGKTARATPDRAKGKNPLHIVSARAAENRLFLGQEVVDERSNEITAIPKLLAVLELTGAIVTIDAMGRQKEIAAKIREKKADYVLAVKGNQEHLEEDIIRGVRGGGQGPKSADAPHAHRTRARTRTNRNAPDPSDGRAGDVAEPRGLARRRHDRPPHARLYGKRRREVGGALFHQQFAAAGKEDRPRDSRSLGHREWLALGVGRVLRGRPQPCSDGQCRRHPGPAAPLGVVPAPAQRRDHRGDREETAASGLERPSSGNAARAYFLRF